MHAEETTRQDAKSGGINKKHCDHIFRPMQLISKSIFDMTFSTRRRNWFDTLHTRQNGQKSTGLFISLLVDFLARRDFKGILMRFIHITPG